MFLELSHYLPPHWVPLCRRLDAFCSAAWQTLRRTPLEGRLVRAVRRGQIDRLRALLDANDWPLDQPLSPACMDWRDDDVRSNRRQTGLTLLHEAARSGHVEAAEVLLERGASVDARTNWGTTPALLAACMGDAILVALFAQWGADLTRRLPSTSTYDDGYVGPTVVEVLGFQTGKAYRGDEYAQIVAIRMGERLEEGAARGGSTSAPPGRGRL